MPLAIVSGAENHSESAAPICVKLSHDQYAIHAFDTLP
jgi:hypothetical protein